MGVQNSKNASAYGLSEEEEREIKRKLLHIEGVTSSAMFTEIGVQKILEKVDKRLKQILSNYFSSSEKLDFGTFIEPYKFIVKGSCEEKASFLIAALKKENDFKDGLFKYVEGILHSFIALPQNTKNRKKWVLAGSTESNDQVTQIAKYLCQELPENPDNSEELASWIYKWSSLKIMEKAVFEDLYGTTNPDIPCEATIPDCQGLPANRQYVSVLDVVDTVMLSSCLPMEVRNEWRLLYSTVSHGESFSKLLDLVTNEGPTLIVIEDKAGYVFGGFAPANWHTSPLFYGNDTSFLFSLKPSVNLYYPSGYNNNYQYLNIQQQTMPNGLGMGGQFNYFGLWVDASFGKGSCSESCTTYKGYKMLSAQKYFEINHLEVWGTGKKPVMEEEEGNRTILDDPKHLESKAMLAMLGKTQHSEGVREPQD